MTLRLSLLFVGVIGLAACDENGNGNGNANGIASLGQDFVAMFNQDRNDDPVDASTVDTTRTPTIEPFDP